MKSGRICHTVGVGRSPWKAAISTGSSENTRLWETRVFVAMATTGCHLALSWARWIHSTTSYPIFNISLNIILTSTPGSSKWSLSFTFPQPKLCMHLSSPPARATCPTHLTLLGIYSLCSFLRYAATLRLWFSQIPTCSMLYVERYKQAL